MIRKKHADADLKAIYPKVMRRSTSLTLFLMVGLGILFPDMKIDSKSTKKGIEILNVDIPETPEKKRLPLERPAVPIETENENVPDDVTIADTELDLDAPVVAIPPPLKKNDVEEEILEFWMVEQKTGQISSFSIVKPTKATIIIKPASPVYPEVARRAGLQGQVLVSCIVTKEGRVSEPRVLKGPDIFRAAALEAVRQFPLFRVPHPYPLFRAPQYKAVRMTITIRFSLH